MPTMETPLPIAPAEPNLLQRKLRRVFIPFLLQYLGILLVYSALDVWLNTRQVPPLGRWWAHGVPLALSLPVILYLRPRLGFLEEEISRRTKARDGGYGLFYLIIVGSLWATLWHVNTYLELATGQLTALRTPTDLLAHPPTRFYTLEYPLIKSRAILVGQSTFTYPKNGPPTAHIYLLCPLYISTADSANEQPPAWVGLEFSQHFHTKPTEAQKPDTLRSLEQLWLSYLQALPLADVVDYAYLERAGRDNDELRFEQIFREQAPEYQVR